MLTTTEYGDGLAEWAEALTDVDLAEILAAVAAEVLGPIHRAALTEAAARLHLEAVR